MAEHSTLVEALAAVQKTGIRLVKDAENPHFKNTYVPLDQALAECLPILQEHGILLVQAPDTQDGQPVLRVELFHLHSPESFAYTAPLVLGKPGPQEVGSAITYMRRYTLLSILGLVGEEDDDAEKAEPTRKPRVTKKEGRPEEGVKRPGRPGVL